MPAGTWPVSSRERPTAWQPDLTPACPFARHRALQETCRCQGRPSPSRQEVRKRLPGCFHSPPPPKQRQGASRLGPNLPPGVAEAKGKTCSSAPPPSPASCSRFHLTATQAGHWRLQGTSSVFGCLTRRTALPAGLTSPRGPAKRRPPPHFHCPVEHSWRAHGKEVLCSPPQTIPRPPSWQPEPVMRTAPIQPLQQPTPLPCVAAGRRRRAAAYVEAEVGDVRRYRHVVVAHGFVHVLAVLHQHPLRPRALLGPPAATEVQESLRWQRGGGGLCAGLGTQPSGQAQTQSLSQGLPAVTLNT